MLNTYYSKRHAHHFKLKSFCKISHFSYVISQPAITCSKLTIETVEQGMKHETPERRQWCLYC